MMFEYAVLSGKWRKREEGRGAYRQGTCTLCIIIIHTTLECEGIKYKRCLKVSNHLIYILYYVSLRPSPSQLSFQLPHISLLHRLDLSDIPSQPASHSFLPLG